MRRNIEAGHGNPTVGTVTKIVKAIKALSGYRGHVI